MSGKRDMAKLWARHSADWRDPAQVASQWREAANLDPRLLEYLASPGWWKTLADLQLTLLVTRENENLIIAASAPEGKPRLSYFPLPHPSGLVVDRKARCVHIASTRNPNQVFLLKPAGSRLRRPEVKQSMPKGAPLTPVSSAFYPGGLYLHDLALIGGKLYGNAVGHNAVARLEAEGRFERVWWPRCTERKGAPVFDRNYIQLNSIAAGETVGDSFFSASSTTMGRLRPGHLRYPVDHRGVIFSGRTREPVCTGLTRPHSARIREDYLPAGETRNRPRGASSRELWVANSGYGEVGYVRDGRLEVVARLPGWTRGLCLVGDVAFVATSRVIPKFARYAPGLRASQARCAVYAVSIKTGASLGCLEWPYGSQIFALDWIDSRDTQGFLFPVGSRRRKLEVDFFYSYLTEDKTYVQQ